MTRFLTAAVLFAAVGGAVLADDADKKLNGSYTVTKLTKGGTDAPDEVVASAKRYGCLVFHDVTNVKHARRALQAGVDGLILVCNGAGGCRLFYPPTQSCGASTCNGTVVTGHVCDGAVRFAGRPPIGEPPRESPQDFRGLWAV